ncbi:MAG: alanine--tRNA ligase [Fastidiosipilaceae bacterium]|nr:alanine--tRNA ligase [Clostridiaceae bacterium]
MKYMGLNEIREQFLAFFESKGHLRLPSFSLIPRNDPSVLLINAGMTPLKPYFTGVETPPRKRVTTCQKCIRTPDIDRVGLTARHGTFFEMLGNFSFGDYFKADAIPWAWEFSTEVLGLPADRIWVTIYEDDDEAFDIWHNAVGLPAERILRFGKEDNFWEHGTGPCGPCSELFFDRGEAYGCDDPNCGVGCECDRYIEYWNLVFTQFDRQEDGSYIPLEHKNIDTGAGLERIACIMQNVDNLFETDTVRAVLDKVCEMANVRYHEDHQTDVGIRVITDHIRSGTMMISDGVRPSNEGRGYVLRRLLRRALRYGIMLGIEGDILIELAPVVIEQSKFAYPELAERSEYILSILAQEERSFKKTVSQGNAMLADLLTELKEAGKTVVPGESVFRLHDTYGFPLDLTREIAAEQGLTVDDEGFQKLMTEQRRRSKEATLKNAGSAWNEQQLPEAIIQADATVFSGYQQLTDEGEVRFIVEQNEEDNSFFLSEGAGPGTKCLVVTDRTPFYADAGGQVGDWGLISDGETEAKIVDTTKTAEGVYLHRAEVLAGLLTPGLKVQLTVDRDRRLSIARNHTATHMVHKSLRNHLGAHVTQAGSSVNPDRLRFDFHYGQPLTRQQILDIEAEVNEIILADEAIVTEVMTADEAKNSGATALFDEKYGDSVRVVSIGDYSSELCGGTHLNHSSQACFFKIISEGSVASGVRRIEAVTGRAAFALANKAEGDLEKIAEQLKTTVVEVPERVVALQDQLKQAEKKFAELERERAADSASQLLEKVKTHGDFNILCSTIDVPDAKILRETADRLREELKPAAVVFASKTEDKVILIAMASPEVVKAGVHAGKVVKAAASICGGGGGGRPDMAQAGGKNTEAIEDALAAAEALIIEQLDA